MSTKRTTLNTLFLAFLCLIFCACTNKNTDLFAEKDLVDALHRAAIHAVFQTADGYKYEQNYLKAAQAFEESLGQNLSLSEQQYAYNQLTFIYLQMNEDSIAYTWIDRLERTKGPLSKADSADYYYNVGVWAYHTFKPQMAEVYLQKALTGYQNEDVYGKGHLKTALCMTQLGMCHYEFSHALDSALMYMPLAYTIFKNDSLLNRYSALCEFGMAMVASSKRDYDGVIAHCDIALKILSESEFMDTILHGRCMCFKGTCLRKISGYERDTNKKQALKNTADSLFKEAIRLSKNKPSVHIEEFYRDIILSKLNDKAQFNHYLDELKEVLRQFPDIYGKPDRLKGVYYDRQDNLDSAFVFYQNVLNSYLKDSLQNRLYIKEVYSRLGNYYRCKHQYDSAMYYFKEVIKYGSIYEHKQVDLKTLMRPDFYKDVPFLFFNFGEIANTLLEKYKYIRKKDEKVLQEAYDAFILTDKLLFPGILSADENSILVYQTEVAEDVYNGAIECAILLYQGNRKPTLLNQAFKFCERPKSFLLFKNKDVVTNKIEPPMAILKEVKELNFNINQLKWRNSNPELLTAYQNKLDNLNASIKRDYPNFHQYKIAQPIEDIDVIRKQLGSNRVLLAFKLTPDTLFTFLITDKETKVYIEPIDTSFPKTVNELKRMLSISNMPVAQYQKVATEIYVKIFGQIPPQYFHQKEVYIVPDGVLNELPFEALVKPTQKQGAHYKDLPYLLYDYPMAYAPSWKILSQNMNMELPSHPNVSAFCYNNLLDLPYSEKEIEGIKTCWQDVKVRIVDDLSHPKDALISDMATCDVLHLSLHASSSSTNKLENKIYLKAKLKEPLLGFELLDKPLKAQLIVLSACETAKGKTEKGEGTFSLSRSFIQIGAKCLISSLWEIDNLTTSQIFSNFYKNLSLKKTIPQSMQAAKISLIEQNSLADGKPQYWAGISVIY